MKKFFLLAASIAWVTSAMAEGYQVNNMSTRQTGMGHVGTAMKLNSESVFFNPAATAFQRSRFDVSIGIVGILSNATYTSLPTLENNYVSGAPEDSDNKLSTPLFAYFNYKPTKDLALGIGFYTPNGSSMRWNDNWSGAHVIQSINLKAYTVQPTLSYKIADRVSLGVGLMITWGNFDLSRSMLPVGKNAKTEMIQGGLMQAAAQFEAASQQYQAAGDAAKAAEYAAKAKGAEQSAAGVFDRALCSAKLEGDSKVAVGVNAGIMWDISDEWSLAMSYRSRMNMKVGTGHATLNYSDPFVKAVLEQSGQIPGLDQGSFNAELPLPTSVTWGVSFRPTTKWEFAVDLQWVGWSAYKELNVVFNETELGIKPVYSVKNYSNTLAFRFGGQYRAFDWMTARMGMYVDESPVSSNYLNPETPSMTKVSYTAGLSFRPAKCLSIDLAYCYVSSADPERTGSYPVYDYFTDKLTSVFSGNYKLHAHVFSFGVGLSF